MLNINKEIQKLWPYAALHWHDVTTKHREYQWTTFRSVADVLKTMQGYMASVSLQFPFLGRKWDIILKEIHLKVANESPFDKRNFYFQSCYAVGYSGRKV
jgi:hypothetical protein